MCAGDYRAQRAELIRQEEAAREREREDRERHTPAQAQQLARGAELYGKVHAGDDAATPWEGLDLESQRVWANAEGYIRFHEEQRKLPGALRFSRGEEPPETYERHLQAVMGVLHKRFAGVNGPPASAWLRGVAEQVLAAAEVGF